MIEFVHMMQRIRERHGLAQNASIEDFVENLVGDVENYKDELERRNRRLHATEEAVTNIRIMLNLEHEPEVSALEAIQRMKIDLKTVTESYKAQEREIEVLRALRDERSDLINRLGNVRMHLKADPNEDLVEVAKARMDEIVSLKDIIYGDPQPAPGRDSALLDMLFDIVDGNVPWDDIKRYLVRLRAA